MKSTPWPPLHPEDANPQGPSKRHRPETSRPPSSIPSPQVDDPNGHPQAGDQRSLAELLGAPTAPQSHHSTPSPPAAQPQRQRRTQPPRPPRTPPIEAATGSVADRPSKPASEAPAAPHGHSTAPPPTRVLLHTPEQAAALLQVPTSWIRRKAATGQIPSTLLGHHLRFSHEDLHEIIRARSRRPTHPEHSS